MGSSYSLLLCTYTGPTSFRVTEYRDLYTLLAESLVSTLYVELPYDDGRTYESESANEFSDFM